MVDRESMPQSLDVLVTVYAYDRPRQLLHLLQDISLESERSSLKIGVNVIDDNSMGCVSEPTGRNIFDAQDASANGEHLLSTSLFNVSAAFNSSADFLQHAPCSARSRFRFVERFIRNHGWHMYVSKYRHGRRRYWHLVRTAHAALKTQKAKYYIFLPDDDRLASYFFEKAVRAWDSIEDTRKTTLMLHIEETREHVPVWTNVKPRLYTHGVYRIGWVESGNFLCTERYLSLLNWSFPAIPVSRWINNPPISSGVGAAVSELIHSSGLRMYRTEESLVAHVGVSFSKMNAEFRKKHEQSLVTKYFADGPDAYENYLKEASTVSGSMASIWLRESALHAAVNSLSHQVDHLNVYLNGYDVVPSFLQQPYITVVQSQNAGAKGDIGDIGKFFWCNDVKTEYHITVDDDIVYPEDYVNKMLTFRQSFPGPAVVGVHGIRIIEESLVPTDPHVRGQGYYGSRKVWMAVEKVPHQVVVHILGTGTILYKFDDFGVIDIDQVFQQPNMADIWLGGLAQKLKIPMMVIPHEADWIREVPGTFEQSIYKKSTKRRRADRLQTEAAKSFVPWQLNRP